MTAGPPQAAVDMRRAARHMREHHGPEHPRHVMWDGIAGLLEHQAGLSETLAITGQDVRLFGGVKAAHDAALAYLAATPRTGGES